MSEIIIPPGYVQLTHSLTHAGNTHTALVTIGGKVESAPFNQANCASHHNIFVAAMAPLWDSEITFSRTVALVGNDGPALRYEVSGTNPGTRTTGTSLPPAVSIVVRKVTAFAGRQYRGRMYLPFPSTLDFGQGGAWASGRQAAVQTLVTTLFGDMTAGTGNNLSEVTLLHADRVDSNGDPIPGSAASPTPITALQVTNFAGTQRRRQVRV